MDRTRAQRAWFEQQVQPLLPRLRRYARMLCRDAAGGDDLLQDTLERAWAAWEQPAGEGRVRAWLFSIMHNTHISHLRYAAARPGLVVADAEVPETLQAPGSVDPAALIDIERALNALGNEHREVLLLVAVEQLAYREVAEVLQLPIGTVMSRLSRAREQLRQRLGDAETAPPLRVVK